MKVIPPVLAVLYLGAAWGVTKLLPNEALIPRSPTSIVIAGILVLSGIALAIAGVMTLRRHGTTVDPFGTPEHLVTNGPFALTRNPMYLAVTLALAGHGIFNGQAAFLAVPFAFLYSVSRYYVPREEKILAELFPAEFAKYREEVRRWV